MIVISDTHLDNHSQFGVPDVDPRYPGCNSRAVVILEAIREAFEYGISAGHEYVVMPGDLFHRRGVVIVDVFNQFVRLLNEYSDRIQPIVMPGNHDFVDGSVPKADGHILFGLKDTIGVVSEPSIINFREGDSLIRAGFIPYTPDRAAWIASAKRLASDISDLEGGFRVLFAHQSFSGAVVGSHEHVMKEGIDPADPAPGWDLIVSGHYHKHQEVRSVVYVGALVQHNFGEREYTPGMLVLSQEGWAFRENESSPRFVVYDGASIEDAREVLESAKLRGDYVQVRWTGPRTPDRELLSAEVESTSAAAFVDQSVSSEAPRIVLEGTESPLDVVDRYVSFEGERNELPSTPSELVSKGRTYLEQGYRKGSV